MLLEGMASGKRSLGDDHVGVLMGCGILAKVHTRQHRYKEAQKPTWMQFERLRKPEDSNILTRICNMEASATIRAAK